MNEQKSIKNMGENLAFTAKGLFKTADILKLEYKILLSISILFSLLGLAFDIDATWVKILGVISIFATIYILINENNQHKVSEFMKLGNDYLTLYDEVEKHYYNGVESLPEELYKRKEILQEKTSLYNISILAKIWVDKTIYKEMNLDWTK